MEGNHSPAKTCDEGYCFLYYTRNSSSSCAPCFNKHDVGDVDSNLEDSTTLTSGIKLDTVLPKKAEDKRKTITTDCIDARFTFWQFFLGLLSGLIMNNIFIIIVLRLEYVRKPFLGTRIGGKVRSIILKYIDVNREEREEQGLDLEAQPLNRPNVGVRHQEGQPERLERTISMSDCGEFEDTFGNELDLQGKKETCPRLSAHTTLFGVEDFVIENLPPGFRDQSYLDYIKATSNLTVRLKVYHISVDRPENDPYHKLRGLAGTGLGRFGSGLVYQVSKSFDKRNDEKCPCKDCQVFPENSKTSWAEFLVVTSAQMVFDEKECSQTSCKLWYDKDEGPCKVPSLQGWGVKKIDRKKDICIIRCVSHDPEVIKELEEGVDIFNRLNVQNKKAPNDMADMDKLAVLIAHPHGLSRKIFLRKGNVQRGQVRKWTYDDYTCPGSIGAPICLLSNKKYSKILITIYNGNCESRGFELDDGMSATALDLDDTL